MNTCNGINIFFSKREQLARQPIRIHYFNICQDRRVHRISSFKSVFHRLLTACLAFLSQLGLPSSAHDFLLVTLLTTMPISISSVSSIVTRVLAPGNSLREPKAHSTTGPFLLFCVHSISIMCFQCKYA
jgi:hypothetical protein